jgi:hypothetical protein
MACGMQSRCDEQEVLPAIEPVVALRPNVDHSLEPCSSRVEVRARERQQGQIDGGVVADDGNGASARSAGSAPDPGQRETP